MNWDIDLNCDRGSGAGCQHWETAVWDVWLPVSWILCPLLDYPAYGCGIRYRYGMFKQKIENGYQVEVPDNWLKDGNPFELRRPEYAKEVRFGGNIRCRIRSDETGRDYVHPGEL